MGFLDRMPSGSSSDPTVGPAGAATSPTQAPAPNTASAGSMGETSRPKLRFLDRMLMKNRQKKQDDAVQSMQQDQAGDAGGPNSALMRILGR